MKVDGNHFRTARFAKFLDLTDRIDPILSPLRILDIGGTRSYWDGLRDQWSHKYFDITIVNIDSDTSDSECYHIRPGNACDLGEYADNSFDVVHSNSVIEHVGKWAEMKLMANEVRRLAPHYFVQTPNLWFPVEPHYRSLFFAWMPEPVRAARLMRRRHGFRGPFTDFDQALADVQTVNLLDLRGMKALFPDGQVYRETVFGLTKSITVIR